MDPGIALPTTRLVPPDTNARARRPGPAASHTRRRSPSSSVAVLQPLLQHPGLLPTSGPLRWLLPLLVWSPWVLTRLRSRGSWLRRHLLEDAFLTAPSTASVSLLSVSVVTEMTLGCFSSSLSNFPHRNVRHSNPDLVCLVYGVTSGLGQCLAPSRWSREVTAYRQFCLKAGRQDFGAVRL